MYCIFIQYENRYESMTVVAIVDYVCGPLLSLPHCTHYPTMIPPLKCPATHTSSQYLLLVSECFKIVRMCNKTYVDVLHTLSPL